MDPETMLAILREHGEDAGSDYNDADDVDGWFGWTITKDGQLVITYEPCTADGRRGDAQTARWRLVPEAGA